MRTLRAHDLSAILDTIADLPVGAGEEALALAACIGVQRLVPCDELGYSVLDRGRRQLIVYISPDGTDAGDNEAFWQIESEHPLCQARSSVAILSERLSGAKLRASRVFSEWYAPLGIHDEAKLDLGWVGGVSRAIMLSRCGRGRFTQRDRQVLETIRPHLARLLAPAPSAGVLTRREYEILASVQRGLSNKEIASELTVSSGTVRKHLENIFTKLEVHSRVAAIAKISQPGFAPTRPEGLNSFAATGQGHPS